MLFVPPSRVGRRERSILATWPLDRRDAARFAIAFALFTAMGVSIGGLLVLLPDDSFLIGTDRDIANWMVAHRTAGWTRVTHIVTFAANTHTELAVTAIVATVLLVTCRRWRETLMVTLPLVLEAASFITITWIVGRPRPDVPRIGDSAVGTSFPSGHVAAAAVYSGIAVVVFWHTRKWWLRAVTVVVAVGLPIAVAAARVYSGMHYVTDVVFGIVLGAAAVLVTLRILDRTHERETTPAPE